MAPGFIAIGSGPAGLTAAEVFRQKHQKIPVHILSSDAALPYAKPPLSKSYLCGRDPKLDAKVKRAEPAGLDWRQGWDDWSDLFQYQVRALQPLAQRERGGVIESGQAVQPRALGMPRAVE